MTDSPSAPGPNPDSDSRSSDTAAFERVDWDSIEPSKRWLTEERVALAVGLTLLGVVYLSHRASDEAYLLWRWSVGPADWLLLLSAVGLAAYGLVPLIRDRGQVRRLLVSLSRRPMIVLSLFVLVTVLGMALYAIVSGFQPRLTLESGTPGANKFQPPVGFMSPFIETGNDCVGATTDAPITERACQGTWTHPLGTDRWGYELTDLLVVGARPVLYATVVALGAIVPLSTAVGLVAGYYGGLPDDLLMAYVDVQLAVPAIVIYLVVYMFLGNSLLLLLVVFGLLSWGGIARIVRSETLQRREAGHVRSAKAAGASDAYLIRRHLLPNVTDSAVPAAFHLIAVLVLSEAALSFLGFHVAFQSWGMTIAEGLFYGPPLAVWWTSLLPAAALAVTVVSIKAVGDGLRDALDPHEDRT
ncbi:ABC transporter permease [Saliphagus sp. LR7]|uniref:ABC transporter permease n=1 Tax=Saliphagus sp. LR7 TaxID=2282654 RepID=UPI000DF7AE97|nr:ABC transporter permease [Saliphagus sp. LR7]